MRKYKVKYIDKFGEEETVISSDGSTMYLTLRGIDFEGDDFEMLEGKIDEDKFEYIKYHADLGDLINFRMIVVFPIQIYRADKIIIEHIKFEFEVGSTTKIEGLSPIVNTVELDASFGEFTSQKQVGWFENSIIEIQNMLPKATQIKTCVSCKYSSYHPIGCGMFGGLHCFKNLKEEASKVSNKDDLMNLWDKGNEEKTSFNVQEVFDCGEHQFETEDDWTYKDWLYHTKHKK